MSRAAATEIVRTLTEAGYVAYFAGGCVRDRLLGVEPKDYDVATNAHPEQVLHHFRGRLVGEAFGVVRVRLMDSDIEVATFRVEWGYTDGRRPDHVEYTDAEHDARRRDFTINGLFENPLTDEVIDYVGGRADLDARRVRAIGDPDARFGEDYLRMLRAVRFTARLGFELESQTAAAIPPLADKLGLISRERIGGEVQAMLCDEDPAKRHRAAVMMQQLHLDAPALNELHQDAALPTLQSLDAAATYPTALAAWMTDRGGNVARWRKALCLSNDHRDALAAVRKLVKAAPAWPDMTIAKRKRWLAHDLGAQALLLLHANPQTRALAAAMQADAAPLHAEGVAPPRLVTGDDLVAMGIASGPQIGVLLEAVYDEQLEGRLASRDEALRWARDQR